MGNSSLIGCKTDGIYAHIRQTSIYSFREGLGINHRFSYNQYFIPTTFQVHVKHWESRFSDIWPIYSNISVIWSSDIWSILAGQNRGPYIRNPVYVVSSFHQSDISAANKRWICMVGRLKCLCATKNERWSRKPQWDSIYQAGCSIFQPSWSFIIDSLCNPSSRYHRIILLSSFAAIRFSGSVWEWLRQVHSNDGFQPLRRPCRQS